MGAGVRHGEAGIARGGRVVAAAGVVHAREGETVTMRISVSGGTKPYRYQWQVYLPEKGAWVDLKDGGGVSGANADTLTLKNVQGAWNGRKARCVVTDADGTAITSDAVTLRVAHTGASTLPDTGDHARLPLYLAVALVSAALLVLLRRRERDSH